jgi:hypothetical protein
VIWGVGDYVHLVSEDPEMPFVGRIIALWEDGNGEQQSYIQWLFRPSELEEEAKPTDAQQTELFLTDHYDVNPISTILSCIRILIIFDGLRRSISSSYGDRSSSAAPIYFCGRHYDVLTFKVSMISLQQFENMIRMPGKNEPGISEPSSANLSTTNFGIQISSRPPAPVNRDNPGISPINNSAVTIPALPKSVPATEARMAAQLQHSIACSESECTIPFCKETKQVMAHKRNKCTTSDCPDCKAYLEVLKAHAKICDAEYGTCRVPNCEQNKPSTKLEHAAKCTETNCKTSHCAGVKRIIEHTRKCRKDDCESCKQFDQVLKKHESGSCITKCIFPKCSAFSQILSHSLTECSRQDCDECFLFNRLALHHAEQCKQPLGKCAFPGCRPKIGTKLNAAAKLTGASVEEFPPLSVMIAMNPATVTRTTSSSSTTSGTGQSATTRAARPASVTPMPLQPQVPTSTTARVGRTTPPPLVYNEQRIISTSNSRKRTKSSAARRHEGALSEAQINHIPILQFRPEQKYHSSSSSDFKFRGVQLGDQYQATIPPFQRLSPDSARLRTDQEEILWDPSAGISDMQITEECNVIRTETICERGNIVPVKLADTNHGKTIRRVNDTNTYGWMRIVNVEEDENDTKRLKIVPYEFAFPKTPNVPSSFVVPSSTYILSIFESNVLMNEDIIEQAMVNLYCRMKRPNHAIPKIANLAENLRFWTEKENDLMITVSSNALFRTNAHVNFNGLARECHDKQVGDIVQLMYSPRIFVSEYLGAQCCVCQTTDEPLVFCRRFFICKASFCLRCWASDKLQKWNNKVGSSIITMHDLTQIDPTDPVACRDNLLCSTCSSTSAKTLKSIIMATDSSLPSAAEAGDAYNPFFVWTKTSNLKGRLMDTRNHSPSAPGPATVIAASAQVDNGEHGLSQNQKYADAEAIIRDYDSHLISPETAMKFMRAVLVNKNTRTLAMLTTGNGNSKEGNAR